MYSLDYEMMVQMLQQFGYSGEVHADISSQAILKGAAKVVMGVHGGTVTACLILNRNGQKLCHDVEAQFIISRLGVLEWRLISSTSHVAAPETVKPPGPSRATVKPSGPLPVVPPQRPVPIGQAALFRPRRRVQAQSQISNWPALQRSVYLLADGARSIEQIAKLLSRHPDVIGQVVRDLKAYGAIE